MDVGSLLFLFNCCLCNSSCVLVKFITAIGLGCLVRTLEFVVAGGAAAVLIVDFKVPDESFKVCLSII
jgi:hypothetical protein